MGKSSQVVATLPYGMVHLFGIPKKRLSRLVNAREKSPIRSTFPKGSARSQFLRPVENVPGLAQFLRPVGIVSGSYPHTMGKYSDLRQGKSGKGECLWAETFCGT